VGQPSEVGPQEVDQVRAEGAIDVRLGKAGGPDQAEHPPFHLAARGVGATIRQVVRPHESPRERLAGEPVGEAEVGDRVQRRREWEPTAAGGPRIGVAMGPEPRPATTLATGERDVEDGGQDGTSPQSAAAVEWLATACGPAARRAATTRPRSVSARCLTA
jgi:hypothetical protein